MAATQNRDMGSGSIPKLLAQLALPAVVAQVVNLLYNIVDRIYIARIPEVGTVRFHLHASSTARGQYAVPVPASGDLCFRRGRRQLPNASISPNWQHSSVR